jgi:uncharacterized membrane protein YebE (DUF533 family)
MKSSMPRIERKAKSDGFVLTRERGERISAVEGMTLTPRMTDLLERGVREGLSGDETRALIRQAARRR